MSRGMGSKETYERDSSIGVLLIGEFGERNRGVLVVITMSFHLPMPNFVVQKLKFYTSQGPCKSFPQADNLQSVADAQADCQGRPAAWESALLSPGPWRVAKMSPATRNAAIIKTRLDEG